MTTCKQIFNLSPPPTPGNPPHKKIKLTKNIFAIIFSFVSQDALYNVGHDYNKLTSQFYVTQAGLYIFSATLHTELDNHISADIVIVDEKEVQVKCMCTLLKVQLYL